MVKLRGADRDRLFEPEVEGDVQSTRLSWEEGLHGGVFMFL